MHQHSDISSMVMLKNHVLCVGIRQVYVDYCVSVKVEE